MRRSVRAAINAASSRIGPREVLTSHASGFISASSAPLTSPAGPLAQHKMDGQEIRPAEQRLFRDMLSVEFRCARRP
ncbi:MAG: hypothetical protein WDN69_28930 [Aliidongia sp.]